MMNSLSLKLYLEYYLKELSVYNMPYYIQKVVTSNADICKKLQNNIMKTGNKSKHYEVLCTELYRKKHIKLLEERQKQALYKQHLRFYEKRVS